MQRKKNIPHRRRYMQKKNPKNLVIFTSFPPPSERRAAECCETAARCMATDNERKGREGSRRGTERGEEGRRREKKMRRSEGRLLLILPYLSLFAETPFVFQVPVIRA